MSYFYSSKLLKDIDCKVVRASAIFKLIEDSDRIAVAFSGGKDSFTFLKMLSFIKARSNRKIKLLIMNVDVEYNVF